jgi:tetratricopeptide (TPR) repeat protein
VKRPAVGQGQKGSHTLNRERPMGIVEKLGRLLKKGQPKSQEPMERYLTLVKKEPGNATAHLKLAELYQKKGDKKKAIAEYLLAAEIFLKNQFYARAMAIYKQVPKQDPSLDHVYLKIADIYRKMGFTGDAFAQYRVLVQHYDTQGLKDRAVEVLNLMADMDPRKSDPKEKGSSPLDRLNLPNETATANAGHPQSLAAEPRGEQAKPEFFDLGAMLESAGSPPMADSKEISQGERVYGFEEIFKELKETSGPSAVDPNFNYNLGVASRELGFLEDAIEQFQIALEKNQNAFEAATLMGLCYKEKGQWSEAAQALQKALHIPGIPKDKVIEVKYELGLICKQEGKTDEALGLMREILAVDQKFRDAKHEFTRLMDQGNPQRKSPA